MKTLKVEEFAEVISGGTPSTKNSEYWGNEIPWVTPKDLSGYTSRYISEGERCISRKGLENSSAKLLPKNTVLLTTRAPIGYVALSDTELTTNQGFKNLICKQDVAIPEFIYYLLKLNKNLLEGHATGSTFKELSGSRLKNIVFTLPDIETQKKIASILSTYDDLFENNRRRIQLLEKAAHRLYREWFIKFRFPGHEHVKFVDGLPEGWKLLSINEVFEINPKVKTCKDKNNIKHFPMGALSATGLSIDLSSVEIRNKYTGSKFRNGDVLFARITPCLENGKTALVQCLSDKEIACGSTEFIIIRPKNTCSGFAYCTARQENFRGAAIKTMIGSSGRQRVQPHFFDNFRIAYPTQDLIDEFRLLTSNNFKLIATLESINIKLSQARDILLPKLINGDISHDKHGRRQPGTEDSI